MSRAVRITVGSVLVGVLAFVGLVAGIMSASSGFGDVVGGLTTAGVDTPATAEVLDVDDYGDGWPTVDVRWTTPDGEVVVTYVDWEWSDELPDVGDEVDVVYDDLDPEFAYAADDPWLQDEGAATEPVDEDQGRTAEVAGWVALAALLGVVVGAVVTVVAAVRAPAPAPSPHVPSVFEAPHPHQAGTSPQPYAQQPYAQQPYAPQPYVPQPYVPQPYAQQPYAPQPYAQQPYAQQPYAQQPYAQQPYAQQQTDAPQAVPAQQWPHPG